MSSILSDKAEPLRRSRRPRCGLRAQDAQYLISSNQMSQFRSGQAVTEEQEVLGRRGLFVHQAFDLGAGEERSWVSSLM